MRKPSMGMGAMMDQDAPADDEDQGTDEDQAETEEPSEESPEQSSGDTSARAQASPEEQAIYEKFVLNCLNILYDPKVRGTVATMLKGADHDPIGVLAKIAVMIVSRVNDSANGQLDHVLMQQGATELIEAIAQLSDVIHAHHYTDEEKQGALYRGTDMFQAELKAKGEIDPNAAKAQMQQLAQADQSGELDRQMPGLKQHFAKAMGGKGKQQPQQQAAEEDA
jgi:hypothetical protein